jgi:hypothetical protein
MNNINVHSNVITSSFGVGNALLRKGHLQEAAEIYRNLAEIRRGFRTYGLNYALAKRNLIRNQQTPSYLKLRQHRAATHPESNPYEVQNSCKFTIVTPAYNAEKFIRDTIESVILQSGKFHIDYVIKDACSSDATLDIVEEFLDRVSEGSVPLGCQGLSMTLESSPDKGMYDAVHTGYRVAALEEQSGDILSYLNADDVYFPRAFEIAATVFSETKAQWICGQKHTIDESGKVIHKVSFPLTYAREDIIRGAHLSGGSLYFIQQEGNFWKRSLYDQVGGINRDMKLAGDFDLWIKFAMQTELLALDRPLASFRSREGQLSENFFSYRDEIEAFGLPIADASNKISDAHSHTPTNKHTLMGECGPEMAINQEAGPVCFLNDDLSIREVAYVKRAWVRGEDI